jgi:flagellar basal-body rod protein FlgF
MDRLLYIAMSGAKETLLSHAVNSQNLANANTVGFKANLAAFSSQPVYGPGYPSRVYALSKNVEADFTPGGLMTTGRELDVAVNGGGWIAIQAPNGNEAYTRAGNLSISSSGILSTGGGYPVMGNSGPIAIPPYEKLEIGTDGTVSIQPLGQSPNTLAVVDRIKLVDPPPAELVKGPDSLLHLRQGGSAAPVASIRLISGSLESSNVNSVESMVNLIELARQFELQVKMMSTSEENDQAATRLMQMG